MLQSAAIGAGRNPPFRGGVAIVFPDFSVSSLWNPNSRGKPQKTKEFKECGDVPPPRFFMEHPPLCPCSKKHAAPSLEHEKHPGFGLSNRLRKPGCPVRRIVVNRDPFRKLRFGKFQEFDVPIRMALHPSVLAQKFQVLPVKRLPNRAQSPASPSTPRHLPRLRRRPKL